MSSDLLRKVFLGELTSVASVWWGAGELLMGYSPTCIPASSRASLRSLYIFVEELRVFLYGVCPCTWCFFVVVVRSGHSFGMNARGVVLAGRRGCVSLPAIKLGACTYMKFGWRYSLYFVMCVWIHSQSLCLCLCTCPLPDDRIGVFAA